MTEMHAPERRREQGSALFVSALMLVMLGLIGLAALDTVNQDQQVAGFLNRKKLAFYAAEAGVAVALDTLEENGTPTVATSSLADPTTYPYGQPSYQLDPTVADPIEDIGIGAAPGGHNLAIGTGGPTFFVQYYKVRVEGQASGGTTSRLEVAAGLLQGI